ncbi:hypothetical protein KKG22_02920 [Patescibacteria group bacterium]|nr:hypothetical protein [Patescibacteria group bacterium]MBU1721466.1 hypothetical protein [Patescibacteria group bacterium]MBU1900777.1 hypothetical protein [Patescibacteria group bacterium]
MAHLSLNRSIFFHRQTLILLFLFFAVRIASYFAMGHVLIGSTITLALISLMVVLFFYRPQWAWYIVLGELFIGGTGHLFELFGISIRSAFFISFVGLWLLYSIFKKQIKHIHIPHRLFFFILLYCSYLFFSALYGLNQGHPLSHVVQDAIPYAFFFFIIPFYYLHTYKELHHFIIRLLIVWLIGTTLFTLYNEILFSSNMQFIHGEYYTWLRDVLMAKITDMGTGFFRIVEPSHLLIAPVLLLISSLLMKKEKHHILWYVMLFCSYILVVLNFSRAYMLGIAAGFFVLLYTHHIKQWLRVGVINAVMFVTILLCSNLIASQGDSTGLDLLGLRFGGIIAPSTEVSAYTRRMLLTPTLAGIQAQPLLGVGIGATLTFQNPNTFEAVSTRHFDWGYFEILFEQGIIGGILFLLIIEEITRGLLKHIKQRKEYRDFHVGLFAGIISLGVIQLFGPAFTHLFGIVFLSIIFVISTKQPNVIETITGYIYQTFHKDTLDKLT